MAEVKVTVVTFRDIFQNEVQEVGKFGQEFLKASALILLDKGDMASLGVKDGGRVMVKSDAGNVVVQAKEDSEAHQGIAFMPNSPWSNQLVPPEAATGIPEFKRVRAVISPSEEKVPTVEDLIGFLRG